MRVAAGEKEVVHTPDAQGRVVDARRDTRSQNAGETLARRL
ncbi:hypothetical protein [Jannaschia sp. CCS1]|nr:hypothetical protein [Jannaschia sp. CCS1]